MAYPQKIKDYAKELFLTPDEKGDHKFTQEEIVKKIYKKFTIEISRPLLSIWSKEEDDEGISWRKLWNAGKRHGITEAKTEIEKKQSSEERIINKIAEIEKNRYLEDYEVREKALEYIRKEEFKNMNEALKAYELASKRMDTADKLEKESIEVKVDIHDRLKEEEKYFKELEQQREETHNQYDS